MKNNHWTALLLLSCALVLALFGSARPIQAQDPIRDKRVYLPLLLREREPPTLGGCPIFPGNSVWNTPVDGLPVHPDSATLINSIGAARHVHADFGSGTWEGFPIGIPFVIVSASTPKVPVSFQYGGESDPGPYPIPANPPVEGDPNGSGDRHILILQPAECKLYELFATHQLPGGAWQAGSGAIFDLRSNALRPAGWTSADAAGLPILPGLARYDEAASGEIRHALRFTVPVTRDNIYTWPARHHASSNPSTALPQMGMRFRLKASFDTNRLASPQARVIATALKKYGMIVADNGSAWYISGAPDPRWDNDVLHELDIILGSDFELVNTSTMMLDPDSGAARQP